MTTITENEVIKSVTIHGESVGFIDNGGVNLWIYAQKTGPQVLVRTTDHYDAYDLAANLFPPIEHEEDILWAYGFATHSGADGQVYVVSHHKLAYGNEMDGEILGFTNNRHTIGGYETEKEAVAACCKFILLNNIPLVDGYRHRCREGGITRVGHDEWLGTGTEVFEHYDLCIAVE